MKKAVWWLSVLTVMMTGTVTANDLYAYRYVHPDGTIVNVTDAGYTKVGNVTVAGKTYWGAFSAVPKSQDTSIIKVATNIPLSKHGNFTVTKRMPDPEYPGGAYNGNGGRNSSFFIWLGKIPSYMGNHRRNSVFYTEDAGNYGIA